MKCIKHLISRLQEDDSRIKDMFPKGSYIPGDFTEEKYRPDSYYLLHPPEKETIETVRRKTNEERKKHEEICERFESHHNPKTAKVEKVPDKHCGNGEKDGTQYSTHSKEDIYLREEEKHFSGGNRKGEIKHKSNDSSNSEDYQMDGIKHKHTCHKHKSRLVSPLTLTKKNFEQAAKCHRENLEHQPLPDTVPYAAYKRMQMERAQHPGMALPEDTQGPTGVAWKERIMGPTQCTKMRIYRSKTAGPVKHGKGEYFKVILNICICVEKLIMYTIRKQTFKNH